MGVLLKRMKALIEGFRVLNHSLRLARGMSKPDSVEAGAIVYRGMRGSEYDQVMALYAALHGGRRLAWPKRMIYRLTGDKLLLVAVVEEAVGDRVVGVDMFYVNSRDKAEHTVHEGFIGVHPDKTGKGVATALRKAAIEHFGRHGLRGVSSRISTDNGPSLASATKLGFVPVDRYHDTTMRAERLYLIRWLQEGS